MGSGHRPAPTWRRTPTRYRNLALQDQFTDTSKELWQFDGWESAAGTAVKPLTTCGTDYRGQLAAYLPTSWGDPKAAQVVADQIGGAALTATDDPRVLVVTPFFPDGRIRLPLDPGNFSSASVDYCGQTSVAQSAGIYRCGSVADHLPACWPSVNFYCLHGQGDDTAVRIWAGTSLPAASEPENPTPWQIVLADGSRCDIRLGGTWDKPPDGYTYSYSCDGNYVALLESEDTATLDQSGATLTVTAQADWGSAVEQDLPTSAYHYEGNAYPGVFQFQKVDGKWRTVARETACPLPSPIPVAPYQICQVG